MLNAGIELVRNNTDKVQAIERVMLFAPFMMCDYNSLVQVQGAMIAGRVVGLINRLCTDSGNSLGFRVQELNRELDSLRGGAVAAAAQARVDREALSGASDGALLNEEDVDPNNSQQPNHHRPSSFYKTIAALDPTAKAIIATHQRTIAADVALQLLDVVDVFVELVVRNPPQALSGLLTRMFAFISGSSSSSGAPTWLLEQRARTCAGWGVVLGIAAFRSGLGLYINRQEMSSVSASAGAHLRMLYRYIWKTVSRGTSCRRRRQASIDASGAAAVAAEGEREDVNGSLPSSVTRPSTETGALVVGRVASPGLVIPTVRIPPRSSLSARHGSRSVRQPSAAMAADEDYRSSSVLGRQRRELETGPALALEEANGSPSPLRPLQDRLHALPSASPAPRALTTSKPPTSTTTHHHHPNRAEDLGLPPNVHLRTFTEYVAFLIDIMGIATPMIWAGIAYLYRPAGLLGVGVSAKEANARTKNYSSRSSVSRLRGGDDAGSSSSWGSWLGGLTRGVLPRSSRRSTTSDDSPRVRNFGPSPALVGSTQQSWGAWRIMLVLNVVRLVVALLVRTMRRPTVVVQIGSSSGGTHHTTLHQHSPHHIADLDRAGSALRTIGNHCLKDPYFSVVIRSFIEDYIVGGRISRIPLVGPIIQAQVGMNLNLQRNSFTFTNK